MIFILISEQWKKKVEDEREWFLKNEWMADESKRVGKKNGVVRPQMEGSFRSLSIDWGVPDFSIDVILLIPVYCINAYERLIVLFW